MIKKPINLLRNESDFHKLCSFLDRDFGCRKAFACSVCCPLAYASLIQGLCDAKNLSIGEAYRITVGKVPDYTTAVSILREHLQRSMSRAPKEDKT